MALVRFSSFYNGPTTVYTSRTGLTDIRTGLPELGGNFNVGDYVDLAYSEAMQWNQQFGTNLYSGRYRIVQLSTAATAANTGLGKPVGWAIGTTVQQVIVAAAGTGYTPGSYTVASSTSGGTQTATATIVVNASGVITSAQLTSPGVGFTSVPTFSLTSLGGGTGGSVLARLTESSNIVTTFDASANSLALVRGVFLGAITAAQITAGAYVVIQELGIANIAVTTATTTAAGSTAWAGTGGTVTTNVGTAYYIGSFATTLDVSAAGAITRGVLTLPALQG